MIKTAILIKQNSLAFGILLLWFSINYFIFLSLTNWNSLAALQYLFYFGELSTNPYGYFYPTMSGFLIFGLILTLITVELYRKYHPLQTCLALARHMSDHAIIIGFSHLGQRIREYLLNHDKKVVIIEEDERLVKYLIEREEPIVPKRPLQMHVLEEANVKDAKLVVCTRNDLELLVVTTNLIRDVNKTCKIVVRCFDDSLAQLLEKQLDCSAISTSKYASEIIIREIEKLAPHYILIIGCTNTTRRLLPALKKRQISYAIIEKNREEVLDLVDEEPFIIGDGKDPDILKEGKAPKANLIIVMIDQVEEVLLIADSIRSINAHCNLICRFYHEELAEILEKPPFNAFVLSTSKHTLEKLIEEGFFTYL